MKAELIHWVNTLSSYFKLSYFSPKPNRKAASDWRENQIFKNSFCLNTAPHPPRDACLSRLGSLYAASFTTGGYFAMDTTATPEGFPEHRFFSGLSLIEPNHSLWAWDQAHSGCLIKIDFCLYLRTWFIRLDQCSSNSSAHQNHREDY